MCGSCWPDECETARQSRLEMLIYERDACDLRIELLEVAESALRYVNATPECALVLAHAVSVVAELLEVEQQQWVDVCSEVAAAVGTWEAACA